MLRIGLIASAMVAVSALFLDPYTWHEHTYAPYTNAPFWRLALTGTEVLLLIIFCIRVFHSRMRSAIMYLGCATLVNVLTNALFVVRDGVERFLVAFNTAETLSFYLTMLALRVAMILVIALGHSGVRSRIDTAG
jgi:hypothetical protein